MHFNGGSILIGKHIVIKNPMGFQVQTVGNLCREAMKFKCSVQFKCRNTITNAKSILSILAAGIRGGDELYLMCEGEDEAEALSYLTEYIESGLGE